nr:MAG TPA_asm: hypothetical protein [Caudoviricetes sp.]
MEIHLFLELLQLLSLKEHLRATLLQHLMHPKLMGTQLILMYHQELNLQTPIHGEVYKIT